MHRLFGLLGDTGISPPVETVEDKLGKNINITLSKLQQNQNIGNFYYVCNFLSGVATAAAPALVAASFLNKKNKFHSLTSVLFLCSITAGSAHVGTRLWFYLDEFSSKKRREGLYTIIKSDVEPLIKQFQECLQYLDAEVQLPGIFLETQDESCYRKDLCTWLEDVRDQLVKTKTPRAQP